jgi:hypothetical protein
MGLRDSIKHWLAVVALVPAISVLGACGQGSGNSRSTAASSHTTAASVGASAGASLGASSGSLRGDEDDDDETRKSEAVGTPDSDMDFDHDAVDNAHKGYYDRDDRAVRDFGHPAGAPDRAAIVHLVKRYYAAAAADDGATGCALTAALRAESLPEDYGPAYLPGATTCAAVLARVFKVFHAQLTAPVHATDVRVQAVRARIILGSAAMPASATEAKLQRGVWKIDHVLAKPLP